MAFFMFEKKRNEKEQDKVKWGLYLKLLSWKTFMIVNTLAIIVSFSTLV